MLFNNTWFAISDCNSPLGLQSEDIPNSDITASSEVSNLPKFVVLNYRKLLHFLSWYAVVEVTQGTCLKIATSQLGDHKLNPSYFRWLVCAKIWFSRCIENRPLIFLLFQTIWLFWYHDLAWNVARKLKHLEASWWKQMRITY